MYRTYNKGFKNDTDIEQNLQIFYELHRKKNSQFLNATLLSCLFGRTMRKTTLFFLHNLVMAFFILLNSINHSFGNQVLISAIAVTYWVAGCVLIYRKKEPALNKDFRGNP